MRQGGRGSRSGPFFLQERRHCDAAAPIKGTEMRIEKQTIGDVREVIDGKDYVDCRFEGTQLVYAGGDLPAFTSCTFQNYRMTFEGAALNTVTMLRAMADPGSGFEPLIADIFPKRP